MDFENVCNAIARPGYHLEVDRGFTEYTVKLMCRGEIAEQAIGPTLLIALLTLNNLLKGR